MRAEGVRPGGWLLPLVHVGVCVTMVVGCGQADGGIGGAAGVTVSDSAGVRVDDRMAGLPDNLSASLRTAIETAPHNETLPAFSGLLLDADRRIWIGSPTRPGAVDRRWIVLEQGEERAYRVVLPESAEALDARGSLLVVLDRTELGEEIIRMVRMGEEIVSDGGSR